jgi:RsiW-degrading membrane proteinase PrsW (M82 family)
VSLRANKLLLNCWLLFESPGCTTGERTLLPTPHAMFLRAFVVIALIEKIAKHGLICGQLTDDQAPDYRGFAVLAAAAGAGFAGAENAPYVLRYGPEMMLAGTFIATPVHICNAIVASRIL